MSASLSPELDENSVPAPDEKHVNMSDAPTEDTGEGKGGIQQFTSDSSAELIIICTVVVVAILAIGIVVLCRSKGKEGSFCNFQIQCCCPSTTGVNLGRD